MFEECKAEKLRAQAHSSGASCSLHDHMALPGYPVSIHECLSGCKALVLWRSGALLENVIHLI